MKIRIHHTRLSLAYPTLYPHQPLVHFSSLSARFKSFAFLLCHPASQSPESKARSARSSSPDSPRRTDSSTTPYPHPPVPPTPRKPQTPSSAAPKLRPHPIRLSTRPGCTTAVQVLPSPACALAEPSPYSLCSAFACRTFASFNCPYRVIPLASFSAESSKLIPAEARYNAWTRRDSPPAHFQRVVQGESSDGGVASTCYGLRSTGYRGI